MAPESQGNTRSFTPSVFAGGTWEYVHRRSTLLHADVDSRTQSKTRIVFRMHMRFQRSSPRKSSATVLLLQSMAQQDLRAAGGCFALSAWRNPYCCGVGDGFNQDFTFVRANQQQSGRKRVRSSRGFCNCADGKFSSRRSCRLRIYDMPGGITPQ